MAADRVMYLEGSDQHRGWFHSSLLESCGTRGRAPYDDVLTHGFTMAEDGRKMSKSLATICSRRTSSSSMAPTSCAAGWPATDYTEDQRIGPEIIKTVVDSYRKLRNTLRWMLGKAALQVVHHIFDRVVTWLAPMLPFTMEEAWLERYPDAVSVHLEQFRKCPDAWRNDELAAKWKKVRQVRRVVTGALEIERKEKRIGSSLEAAPFVHVTDDALREAIEGLDMAEICITSAISISPKPAPGGAFTLPEVSGVAVVPEMAMGTKCARSWRVTQDVGSDPAFPDVSARDAAALHELQKLGRL
jgi:isoleucyl-tRNA synthetase